MASLTNCPKCGSERIAFAHEEAPPWATKWTKCFACGKRWNLDGGPPKRKPNDDDEPIEAVEIAPPADRSRDIVALVMKAAREQPAQTQPIKEQAMSGPASQDRRCSEILKSGTRCGSGARKASDVCQRHFDKRSEKVPAKSLTTLPAKRATAPIVLADPTILNPVPIGREHSPAMPALNDLIASFESHLVTLRAAREIVERHG